MATAGRGATTGAEEPVGVQHKLSTYSLNRAHSDGGPKAEGFARILGITIDAIDHLVDAIHRELPSAPITAVRENRTGGLNCVVEFEISGVGACSDRTVSLKTVWEIVGPASRPRLVTAYLKP
jgi:hypothetical protein